jgi:hypothetical protein
MDPITVAKLWMLVKPIKRIKARRKARKAARKGKDLLLPPEGVEKEVLQALKSKTIWLGVVTEIWGLVQVILADGNFTAESIVTLLSGVAIIVLRAVTTKPLAAK